MGKGGEYRGNCRLAVKNSFDNVAIDRVEKEGIILAFVIVRIDILREGKRRNHIGG
jgi:hypothetical protein